METYLYRTSDALQILVVRDHNESILCYLALGAGRGLFNKDSKLLRG